MIKSHLEEKWEWPYTRGAPQNLGFPFNIFALAEASDIKIGMRLEVAKAHNKFPRTRKSRPVLVFSKILGFPFNISAMTEASDFKIGMQLRFAKTHNKIPLGRKSGRGLELRSSQNFVVSLSYF